MRKIAGNFAVVFLATAFAFMGCVKEKPPRSYVQANVIDKAFFQGEWWFGTRVIDVNYPFEGLTYVGDSAYNISSNGYTIERIRWVIDENYLYAFRSYEIVAGANSDATDEEGNPTKNYIGEPLAAYKIESHFDIRRQYNPTTGEEYNIIEENTYDKKWYERRYMRVDWSQNLMVSWYMNMAELYSEAGILQKESVPMFVQEHSQWEDYFPFSWKPTFTFCAPGADKLHGTHFCDDPSTPEREGDYTPGELIHMSFVTQAIYTPGVVPDPYTGEPVPWCMSVYVDAPICTTNLVTMRSSFLKISPHHEYEPLYYPDRTRFDHFGTFRVERWTLDRITGDDPSDPALGETDFLDYYTGRYNIWGDVYDDNGNLIPYEQRPIREVVFHTSKEMPRWLIRPSFKLMAEWNEVLMAVVREKKNQGRPLRDYTDPRNYFTPPDPTKRDINCWIAGIDPNSPPGDWQPVELLDPLRVGPDGKPVEQISGWEDFNDENRLAMFYDPNYTFTAPDGRSVQPGNECLLHLYVNSCEKPLFAFPEEEQEIIRRFMADSGIAEDEFDKRVTDDDLYGLGIECEERGDMRYRLLSYISMPGCPFLGVATIQLDPITGENIWGDANIGAWDLHRYRVRATDEIDLTSGDTSELEFLIGEDVRGYYEGLGYVMSPVSVVEPDWLQSRIKAVDGISREGIRRNMERVMRRLQKLKGAAGKANLFTSRRYMLHGTDIERMLLNNDDSMAMAGMIRKPEGTDSVPLDAIIDSISPFKFTAMDIMRNDIEIFTKFTRNNVLLPSFFIDYSVSNFVETHRDWPRKNLIFKIEQELYYETIVHEFGHILNLRHNFRGTADPWNFPEPYYDIVSRYPKPVADDFDYNNDGVLDNQESADYKSALDEVQRKRELNNEDPEVSRWGSVDKWATSSMMDYTPNWYNRMIEKDGMYIDPYDKAVIYFSYGNLVEVYDNRANHLLAHCHDPASGRIDDCITPDKVAKGLVDIQLWTYYGGGKVCSSDIDCPYFYSDRAQGERAFELKREQIEAGIVQTCDPVEHMCTSFWDDMAENYPGDRPDFVARRYKFCSDERRTDIGGDDAQCNIFDEGGSYREIVKNWRDTYHRKYIFNNFRRYRGRYDFYPYYSSIVGRFFLWPVKIFQQMIYRYEMEPDYRTDTGPFGFYDQYMASVDLLNFWNEVMAWPDVGEYRYITYKDSYMKVHEDPEGCTPGTAANCVRVPLGPGKYAYSRYQKGLNGIYRIEYFGTLYEKFFALQMLLLRDLAFSYSPDEAFYVNFYDVFPEEIINLIRGMISEDPYAWKPRIIDVDESTKIPVIQFPDLYRGNCLPEERIPDPSDPEVYSCRPEPFSNLEGYTALDDNRTFLVQMYALIFGLSDLPVYFDTSPQEMLHVYKVGSLFDADVPNCQCDPDCTCDCDLTAGTCDTGCLCDPDCYTECRCDTNETCEKAQEGVDYVTFTSDKTHQTFLAFQVEDMVGKKGGSIAFELVERCKQLQVFVHQAKECLRNGDPASCGYDSTADLGYDWQRATYDLSGFESTINYMIELQQMYGIKSWMAY